ncbi:unnamed protein product [Staurois parvus]|uniref:Uncharacterized protein n=1 Tax=Staurois parvus TaxID=386267 RepID=A0ABN9BT57_9NEOB|nr:unnamed protein product [Staurois parvus]
MSLHWGQWEECLYIVGQWKNVPYIGGSGKNVPYIGDQWEDMSLTIGDSVKKSL